MPKYKLIYFNSRGRAELARLILAYGGQEYEDFRFEREDWPKYKDNTPFGSTPVLEVDGAQISQSKTIARFLAGKFGIAGETDIERAQASALVELMHDDYMGKLINIYYGPEEKKEELKKQLVEEFMPALLANLSKQLTGDYYVGNKLTWADIAVAEAMDWHKTMQLDVDLDKFPQLRKHSERVLALPKIAEWIKTRPKTDH